MSRCHALCESRMAAAVSGQSDDWLLTAIVVGVAGKIATFTTSLILYSFAWQLFRVDASLGFSGTGHFLSAYLLFKALIIAPIIESAFVLAVIWLLREKLKVSSIATVVLSGAIHVPLHGLSVASLSVFPLFALHTIIQMHWMKRGKALGGYRVVTAAHAITNAIAIVTMILL